MLDDNHDYFVYKTFTHKSKQARLKPLSKPISQPPPSPPSSYQPPDTVDYLRFLYVSSSGEDSFVITSRQLRIDWCLQCAFQGLVHGPFLESIMLFSSWEEDSLYPASRCRATMELSPHPNDIRVRLVDMSVPWQTIDNWPKPAQLSKMPSWLNLSLEM